VSFPGGHSSGSSRYRAIALPGVGDLQARYSSCSLFPHPLPLRLIWRPHCHLGIYQWQQSQETRAATFLQCLQHWTYERPVREGRYCWAGIWFSHFSTFSLGFSYSLYISYDLNVFIWICKIGSNTYLILYLYSKPFHNIWTQWVPWVSPGYLALGWVGLGPIFIALGLVFPTV